MRVFYSDSKSYDQTPISGSSLEDVDETAVGRYRSLREKINPAAEELTYTNSELLESLGCMNKANKSELNLAGLVLFGSSKTLRSYLPMLRVDYIRVPGNIWVENPDDRFTTIDMRGPLLTLVFRLIDAINADLPKGFLLPEGSIQAESVGLPTKALREAIVNAVMHRSYREHRPIQVIRYDNRLEIINPGYSLKSPDHLGDPGSETRNPFIAAVFHDTNLAETKGSGIRAMRRLMGLSHLSPPIFESDRSGNQFTSRLLLHHFLDEKDLKWLEQFSSQDLNDSQKQALIFVRELGAIDNQTYRQMTDCDTLKASIELRALKAMSLLAPKGKGRATYYVPGLALNTPPPGLNTPPPGLNTPPPNLSTPPPGLSTPPSGLSTPPPSLSTPPRTSLSTELLERIDSLGKRLNDETILRELIKEICKNNYFKSIEIAELVGKREDYIKRKYLGEMVKSGELIYLHPEMINHPEQAYKTV